MIYPKSWWANAIGVLSFLSTLFIGLVTWDTLKDDSGRIVMHEGSVRGFLNANGELRVVYKRGFRVNRDGDGYLQRKIVCTCPKGQIDEYDLPVIQRHFAAQEYPPVSRWLETPLKVDPGTDCVLQVHGQWRHRFAITNKHYMLDELKFKVEGKQQ